MSSKTMNMSSLMDSWPSVLWCSKRRGPAMWTSSAVAKKRHRCDGPFPRAPILSSKTMGMEPRNDG